MKMEGSTFWVNKSDVDEGTIRSAVLRSPDELAMDVAYGDQFFTGRTRRGGMGSGRSGSRGAELCWGGTDR
jgi:hypothetical protein